MKTHKLTVEITGVSHPRTFYTVAPNTEAACEKVRRYLASNNIQATIETCTPKELITIVETVTVSPSEDTNA